MVWKATLNQTNIGQNNNKFYIIQLLQSDANANQFYVWNRWGRVGYDGQSKNMPFSSLMAAKAEFEKKFEQKTSQTWEGPKHDYVKVSGKYFPLMIDEEDEEESQDDSKTSSSSSTAITKEPRILKSKLPPTVKQLIDFISDKQAMIDTMSSFEIDVKKFPLGKISKTIIKKAYDVLKQIEEVLKGKKNRSQLDELSSLFYTYIPTPVGMHQLSAIQSEAELKKKMQVLEALGDIEIAQSILKQASSAEDEGIDPADKTYDELHCKIEPVDKDSELFAFINEYVQNTHGQTHFYKLELLDLFKLTREGEEERFEPFESDDNRMLLWHGSRRTNWVGILSQGLRIAPPEAPSTGYMFGKGLYFADMCSKSANYCHAYQSGNIGIMMLCEVSLGKMYGTDHAEYMEKPRSGFQSTWGKGRTIPDPSMTKTLDNGCKVPMGTPIQGKTGGYLEYNEFIVYNVAQSKCKYLLKLRFSN